MFDTDLLFYNAATVTTTTDGVDLDIKKTGNDGVTVEVCVTALAGSTTGRTLDVIVKESDDDSTYTNLATFDQITTTGRWTRKVQTQKRYLRASITAGAATGLSATVTAGIVSGNLPDQVA